jgi:hypothetical protein
VQPLVPHALREVLAGQAELIDQQPLVGHLEIVERFPKPVADDRIGIVQDRIAHQPAF